MVLLYHRIFFPKGNDFLCLVATLKITVVLVSMLVMVVGSTQLAVAVVGGELYCCSGSGAVIVQYFRFKNVKNDAPKFTHFPLSMKNFFG